jgi:hypothetical protein
MEPCVINKNGVGEHNAALIEAEEFSALDGRGRKVDLGPTRSGSGGDAAGSRHGYAVSLSDGASIRFTLVHDIPTSPTAVFRVARGVVGACTLTVTGKSAKAGRSGNAEVVNLGKCTVPSTGDWSRFVDVKCVLNESRASSFSDREIALYASASNEGGGQELVRVDSFRLE